MKTHALLSALMLLVIQVSTHAQTAPPSDHDDGGEAITTITTTPTEIRGDSQGPIGYCGGVTIEFTDEEPIYSRSGGFKINATYEASIPSSWRTVINFAIAEWESVLRSRGVNPAIYPITFRRVDLGKDGPLARAYTQPNNSSGVLVRAEIEFNTNTQISWFIDPTPASDSDVPTSNGFDLLTVVRHELGHTVGWTGRSSNPRVVPLVSGNTFDPNRLNIGLDPAGTNHANEVLHPGELMLPSIWQRTRRSIALYPTGAMVARAFEYQIPMQFADPAFTGSPNGSAVAPWRSFAEANASGSSTFPILLAPRTFTVPPGATYGNIRQFVPARGGSIVTTP